jgi:hypothetical protein
MKREHDTIRDIVVPRTPKKAFNPNRRPSGLIQAQIQHLEAAAGIDPARVRGRTSVRTEGESADYIARLTALVTDRKGTLSGPQRAMTQPPVPIAGTPTPTSTTRLGTAGARATAAPAGRTRTRKHARVKPRSTKSRASGSRKVAGRTKKKSASSRRRSKQ